jgi:hypothetical protein
MQVLVGLLFMILAAAEILEEGLAVAAQSRDLMQVAVEQQILAKGRRKI